MCLLFFHLASLQKIEKLKSGIDKDFVEEPLNKLKVRIEKDHPKLKFKLKSVTISQVKKSLKKMKNKKSSGIDGLTQEKLKLGVQALAAPLTDIIKTADSEQGCQKSLDNKLFTTIRMSSLNLKGWETANH